jgi:hypothetical protein
MLVLRQGRGRLEKEKLAPGVKLHRVSFYKGPVDSLEVPAGIKGATSAQGNFRTILSGSWPEGWGLHHCGIRA